MASTPQVRHYTVDDESAGQRLDNFLLRELKGVPKTHVYRIIRSGEVRINKGRAQADTRLQSGDLVRVPPIRPPVPGSTVPPLTSTQRTSMVLAPLPAPRSASAARA